MKIAVCLALGSLHLCEPERVVLHPFRLIPQEASQWCWAAAGEMVMGYYDASVPQCRQAVDYLQATDAAVTECPCAACLNGNEVQEVLLPCNTPGMPQFARYFFKVPDPTKGTDLTFDGIKRELDTAPDDGGPVAFEWGFTGETVGHMEVIFGYKVIDGDNWVLAYDPYGAKIPCVPSSAVWMRFQDFLEAEAYKVTRAWIGLRRE